MLGGEDSDGVVAGRHELDLDAHVDRAGTPHAAFGRCLQGDAEEREQLGERGGLECGEGAEPHHAASDERSPNRLVRGQRPNLGRLTSGTMAAGSATGRTRPRLASVPVVGSDGATSTGVARAHERLGVRASPSTDGRWAWRDDHNPKAAPKSR